MSFYEKDTVIVGASGGLGKSIALSLAEKDMFRTVHLVGRNLDKMEQTASEMRDIIIDDSKVFVHELDLTDEKKVIEFLDKNINSSSLDHVLRYTSRIEALVHDNMATTLSDDSNLYNCRIESTELNALDEENEYVVLLVWKGQHTGNIS